MTTLRRSLALNPLSRVATAKLAARRFTSHSKGPGRVSSKSLRSKTIRRSGDANTPKLLRCASPHSWTPSPARGRRREVGRHRQRAAAVERERRHQHPAVPDRDQLRDPRLGLPEQQVHRVRPGLAGRELRVRLQRCLLSGRLSLWRPAPRDSGGTPRPRADAGRGLVRFVLRCGSTRRFLPVQGGVLPCSSASPSRRLRRHPAGVVPPAAAAPPRDLRASGPRRIDSTRMLTLSRKTQAGKEQGCPDGAWRGEQEGRRGRVADHDEPGGDDGRSGGRGSSRPV